LSDGRRYLVDTSAWIETLRADGNQAVRARVSALTADDRAVLCDIVRLELWNGARSTGEHRVLRQLEQQLETVPTTGDVWTLACEIARSARGKGLTVPVSDLLIAACAQSHGLGIVHCDAHFESLEKLR
jgi:predicted nucleic acid-binding protein